MGWSSYFSDHFTFAFACHPYELFFFLFVSTSQELCFHLRSNCSNCFSFSLGYMCSFFCFLFQRRGQEFWWWGYRPLGKFPCLPALFSGSLGLVSSHFVFLLFSLNKFYMWPLGKLRPTSGSALDSEYYC